MILVHLYTALIIGYEGNLCETDVDECNLFMQENTTDADQGNWKYLLIN